MADERVSVAEIAVHELREALDAEVRAEQEIDRKYWEPLKREMEAFRRAEREGGQTK